MAARAKGELVDEGSLRAVLRAMFDAALAAADPARCLPACLPPPPRGRCVVVGAGKAAASMAAAVDRAWPQVALGGAVVTRDGHDRPAGRIAVLQAAHPVPDARSVAAARHMLQAVAGLGPDDMVLALISGGASALMALPAAGVTLAQKQAITRDLLRAGAPIGQMNLVRRALSAIKGGRLAAACAPASVVTLAISDVPGDDPLAIGSGPTIQDPAPPAAALAVLERWRIPVPPALRAAMLANAAPPIAAGALRLIATPAAALQAAADAAQAAGLRPVLLGDALEGEAAVLGREMAALAAASAPPCVLLSGGETTVTLGGSSGRGGRNCEFLLAMAVALAGHPRIAALAADTDGIDGTEDAAGAFITPATLPRAAALGLDPAAALHAHDSYPIFLALGDLLITGPTRTNVNDFRAVIVV